MSGQTFDAASDPDDGRPPARPPSEQPFLGIQFSCCRTYARVYRRPDNTAYEGRCPRCGKRVRIGIGPGGSGQRFFTAGN